MCMKEKFILHIRRSEELIENGVALKLPLKAEIGINCYAYALGLIFPMTRNIGVYNPGYINGNPIVNYAKKEKIKNTISEDLEFLGRGYRVIECNDKVSVNDIKLNTEEYLVKVFRMLPNDILENGDIHLMRQDPISKKWFHKEGWDFPPGIVFRRFFKEDKEGNLIEPIRYGDIIEYEPVFYFVIKEK